MGVEEQYVLAARFDPDAGKIIYFCDMEQFVYRCSTVGVYGIDEVRDYIDRMAEAAAADPSHVNNVGLGEVAEAMRAALEAHLASL